MSRRDALLFAAVGLLLVGVGFFQSWNVALAILQVTKLETNGSSNGKRRCSNFFAFQKIKNRNKTAKRAATRPQNHCFARGFFSPSPNSFSTKAS